MSEELNGQQTENAALPVTEPAAVESEAKPDAIPEAKPEAKPEEAEEKSRAQKRIDQLTREKYEERRAREAQESRIKELEAKLAETTHKPVTPPDVNLQYDNPEAYAQQQADYVASLAAQRIKEQERQATEARLQLERQEQSAKRAQSFMDKCQKGASNYDGFFEKLNDPVFNDITLRMSHDVISVIQESEKGPDIAYHLATHIDEADRLARLNPVQAAVELARLEARLEVPKPNKVTQAPAPIQPLQGSDSATVDPDKMTDDEWWKWRNKQGR